MVSAEAAVALPVLVLVAVFAVAVVLAAGQRTRLVDAAHVTALAAARDAPDAVDLGRRLAPGARIAVDAGEDTVTVTVTADLALGPVHGPTVVVSAVAPREPGPSPPGATP